MIEYNRHIFDQIDTEEKAYWLGFILADGYLNTNKHMLRIKIEHAKKQEQNLKNTFFQVQSNKKNQIIALMN